MTSGHFSIANAALHQRHHIHEIIYILKASKIQQLISNICLMMTLRPGYIFPLFHMNNFLLTSQLHYLWLHDHRNSQPLGTHQGSTCAMESTNSEPTLLQLLGKTCNVLVF